MAMSLSLSRCRVTFFRSLAVAAAIRAAFACMTMLLLRFSLARSSHIRLVFSVAHYGAATVIV